MRFSRVHSQLMCVCMYVCVFFVCMRDYAGESPAGNGSTWFVERSGSITPFSPKGFHSTFPQLLRPYFLIFTASIPSLIVLFALSFAILSLHPTWPRITRARHVRSILNCILVWLKSKWKILLNAWRVTWLRHSYLRLTYVIARDERASRKSHPSLRALRVLSSHLSLW